MGPKVRLFSLLLFIAGIIPSQAIAGETPGPFRVGVNYNFGEFYGSQSMSNISPGFGVNAQMPVLSWLDIGMNGAYFLRSNYFHSLRGGYMDFDLRIWNATLYARFNLPEFSSIQTYALLGGGYSGHKTTGESGIVDHISAGVVYYDIDDTTHHYGLTIGAGIEVDWRVVWFVESQLMDASPNYLMISGGVRYPIF